MSTSITLHDTEKVVVKRFPDSDFPFSTLSFRDGKGSTVYIMFDIDAPLDEVAAILNPHLSRHLEDGDHE